MSPKSARPLRLALSFNLVFSASCGLAVLLAGPAAVGAALGPFPGWLMTGLGVGLIGFAALIGVALWRLRVAWALVISGLDLLWVISTLPLVAIPRFLTGDGQLVVAGVAAVVALACILQLVGLRAMLRDPDRAPNTFRHCVRLTSRAAPDTLWPVIRDLGAISRYSAALTSSRLDGGDRAAPGVVRVCTNPTGQTWSEEVVSIDDDARSLVLRFRTEATDFPLPFAAMSGGWSVEGTRAGSIVDIWWTVRPENRRVGWMLFAAMAIQLDRDMPRVVAAMAAGGADQSQTAPRGLPTLAYC